MKPAREKRSELARITVSVAQILDTRISMYAIEHFNSCTYLVTAPVFMAYTINDVIKESVLADRGKTCQ